MVTVVTTESTVAHIWSTLLWHNIFHHGCKYAHTTLYRTISTINSWIPNSWLFNIHSWYMYLAVDFIFERDSWQFTTATQHAAPSILLSFWRTVLPLHKVLYRRGEIFPEYFTTLSCMKWGDLSPLQLRKTTTDGLVSRASLNLSH